MAGVTASIVAPILIGRCVTPAREIVQMPARVNYSFAADLLKFGQSINIPATSVVTGRTVVPGSVPPASAESTPTSTNLILDQLYEAPFTLQSTDISAIQMTEGYIPMQVIQAVRTLANRVDTTLLTLYKDIYNTQVYATATTGVIANDPNSSSTSDLGTASRVLYSKGLVPPDDRHFVCSPLAYLNLAQINAIQAMYASGTNVPLMTGNIPFPVLGFNVGQSQNVLYQTAGTFSDGAGGRTAKITANLAAGATTTAFAATVATLTGTILLGDLFTIAGCTSADGTLQVFTCTNVTGVTAAANAMTGVTFQPPLPSAVLANAAVLVYASHRAHLAFHRDAFAYGTRFFDEGVGLTDNSDPINFKFPDPVSQLILGFKSSAQYYQKEIAVFNFWGSKRSARLLPCAF